MVHLKVHRGEVRVWDVGITGADGADVSLVDVDVEVVIISRTTGVAVLALTSDPVAGIGADGKAIITAEQSASLTESEYRVMTWVTDDAGPQVADDETRLRVLPAKRAADVPAPVPPGP